MTIEMPLVETEAPRNCDRCPRLVEFRNELRRQYPDWWNAPVPAWGDAQAWLAIIGLAPGLKGANRTGRPFTGDHAGDLLYATMEKAGLTQGRYDARTDDGFTLSGAIILNSVKCLPPQNKPTMPEIAQCRDFLKRQLGSLSNISVLVALGQIAHRSLLKTLELKASAYPFGHGVVHKLPDGRTLIDSYHCSRYNTQTGRLTDDMFARIFEMARECGP